MLCLGGVSGEGGLGASEEYVRTAVRLLIAVILDIAWLLTKTLCICDETRTRSANWLIKRDSASLYRVKKRMRKLRSSASAAQ